ncbi:MAG: amidohydrolase family protein [Chloroflexota bacterium]
MSDLAELAPGGVVGRLAIEDALLVDPLSGRSGRGSIVVEDGVVVAVEWAGGRAGGSMPSVVVAPAFVDLRAHVREPGGEEAGTFATELDAAAHGGFGFVATMADTRPPVDRPEVVQRVLAAGAATASPVRTRPWGALTVGREGKVLAPLASLASAGVVGFGDVPAPTIDPAVLRAALTEAGALGMPVVVHPDEPSLSAGAEANEGLPATILGLQGASAAAEVSAVARAVAVLRQVSAEAPPDVRPHLHLAHLSVAGSLDAVRAARADGLRVTCDVSAAHLALHDGWPGGDRRWSWDAAGSPWAGRRDGDAPPYHPSTRATPPLRGPEDAIALLAAIEDGTVDAISSDHAPARTVDVELPFGDAVPGMTGLETTLGLVLEAVAAGRLGLVRAMRALSLGPWRALEGGRLDLPEPGLRVGAEANLVVFDREDAWEVSGASLRSRGHNTPLMGRSLPGGVLLTIARGRLAWSEPE